MTTVTMSNLKKNPAGVFVAANDFPIEVLSRNKTKGYVLSPFMFEKLIELAEDYVDSKAVESADYKNGTSLDDLIVELGLN